MKSMWKPAQESGLAGALVERLVLNSKGVQAMAQGLREIAAQKDPWARSSKPGPGPAE